VIFDPLFFLFQQAGNQFGMSEDALKAVSMMFRHFNKNNTGRLAHIAF
jgi:hypothetical protein